MSEGSFTGEIHCHQINKNILYGEDLSKTNWKTTTINVHVQAASLDEPHPRFGCAEFGKK